MGSYLRPPTVEAALVALSTARKGGRPLTVVAGATDHFPARVGRVVDEDVLDISGISELRGIVQDDRGWWIPALTTWSEVIEHDLPPHFDGLRAAGRTVGGRQIQNRGTIVGNIVNASPAADGTPNLLVLDAVITLGSVRGRRQVPTREFVTGNRATVREPDELVLGLFIPVQRPGAAVRSTFLKLGSRAYLVISIAMVAVVLVIDEERINEARVAVGSCSPVAQRLSSLEVVLVGQKPESAIGDIVTAAHLADLTPIDDIRGSAAYRRDAALTLVRRALREAVA